MWQSCSSVSVYGFVLFSVVHKFVPDFNSLLIKIHAICLYFLIDINISKTEEGTKVRSSDVNGRSPHNVGTQMMIRDTSPKYVTKPGQACVKSVTLNKWLPSRHQTKSLPDDTYCR